MSNEIVLKNFPLSNQSTLSNNSRKANHSSCKTTVSILSIKKELFKFINKNAISNYVFKIKVIGNILSFVFKREHSNKCFTTVIPEVHIVLQSRRCTWYLAAIY